MGGADASSPACTARRNALHARPMDDLLNGYRRFRAGRWPEQRDLYKSLARVGQSPPTLVIACCDSRVDPATIFDAGPGELFIIRNVANLAPPFEQQGAYHGASAAIEFAVSVLKVTTILVLGHAQCGGCAAALEDTPGAGTHFLGPWLSLLEKAKTRIPSTSSDRQTALEYESIRVTLENLLTFPFVESAVAVGKLSLVGARFGVADGILELMDANSGQFRRVD